MKDLTGKMLKATGIRGVVVKINVAFLALLLLSCLVLLLPLSSLIGSNSNGSIASLLWCTLSNCKVSGVFPNMETSEKTRVKVSAPSFLDFINGDTKIGLVNMEEDDPRDWSIGGNSVTVQFERVSSSIEWKDLFPEREIEGNSKALPCPEIPMPDFTLYDEVDVVIARLPCRKPEEGWNKDVLRLQVHMVSANMAIRKGRRDEKGAVKVVFLSKCEPMMDIFRCDDLVKREGEWLMYEAKVEKLEDKLRLPLGTCYFALPTWDQGKFL